MLSNQGMFGATSAPSQAQLYFMTPFANIDGMLTFEERSNQQFHQESIVRCFKAVSKMLNSELNGEETHQAHTTDKYEYINRWTHVKIRLSSSALKNVAIDNYKGKIYNVKKGTQVKPEDIQYIKFICNQSDLKNLQDKLGVKDTKLSQKEIDQFDSQFIVQNPLYKPDSSPALEFITEESNKSTKSCIQSLKKCSCVMM